MTREQTKKVAIFIGILLVILSIFCVYRQVKEHYLQDDPMLKELYAKFKTFFAKDKRWEYPLESLNKRDIMDEIDLYRGNKSYTINKQKVYLCLKDENRRYYDANMLVYVLAHEIAHVINTDIGHTEKFNTIFEALLKKLSADGIYNPNLQIDDDYCVNGDKEVA